MLQNAKSVVFETISKWKNSGVFQNVCLNVVKNECLNVVKILQNAEKVESIKRYKRDKNVVFQNASKYKKCVVFQNV